MWQEKSATPDLNVSVIFPMHRMSEKLQRLLVDAYFIMLLEIDIPPGNVVSVRDCNLEAGGEQQGTLSFQEGTTT